MKQHNKISKFFKKYRVSILFALPFLSLFFVFTVLSVVVAFALSFTRYDILRPAEFVGIDNYLSLFLEDDAFLIAFKNTVLFACVYAPLSILVCIMVAWVINDFSPAIRTVLTFIFYAPSMTGGMAAIWALIFSGDAYGFLNQFLMNLGFVSEPIQWTLETQYFFAMLLIVSLWGCFGVGFLSFVSAFRGIDSSLYEAGAIDGVKNRFQELWNITLPILKPQLMFTAVTSITGAFEVGAISSQLFGNPSPQYAAHTLALHMSDYTGTRMEFGTGCAIAVILFIMQVGANKLFAKFVRRIGA